MEKLNYQVLEKSGYQGYIFKLIRQILMQFCVHHIHKSVATNDNAPTQFIGTLQCLGTCRADCIHMKPIL